MSKLISKRKNVIKTAIQQGNDLIGTIERAAKYIIERELKNTKFITVYNVFVSVEYSLDQIKKYYDGIVPSLLNNRPNRLLIVDDYRLVALLMAKEEYPNYASSSWKTSIVKWRK